MLSAMTPDIISLFRGELIEDLGNSFKLNVFLILVLGAGALTFHGITALIEYWSGA